MLPCIVEPRRGRDVEGSRSSLERTFTGTHNKSGDEEWVPQRKMNLTVKEQKNLRLKLTDLSDRVAVLQREWVCSALFMLYKHQNEFLEGGDNDKIRNVTLCGTNRSGKQIVALLNRLLLSYSKFRAPLIDGILKICSVGDDFEQVHNLYASD